MKLRFLDDEPLTELNKLKALTDCAKRCVQCNGNGETHHWLEECDDDGEPIEVCKHCDAWREPSDNFGASE